MQATIQRNSILAGILILLGFGLAGCEGKATAAVTPQAPEVRYTTRR